MQRSSGLLSSKQGQLDCLCGAYSLINIVNYLYDGRIKRRALLRHILYCYYQRWDIYDFICEGLDIEGMDYLIKHVLLSGHYYERYPVNVSKPYAKRKIVTTKLIINEMTSYLNNDNHFTKVILICNQYHWTVINKIDNGYVYFFDSTKLTRSRITSFSLIANKTRHQLLPKAIYFIERPF